MKGLDRNIRVLNIYVPYHRHLEFSNSVVASSILNDHSLIVVGDLNLTLSMDEVWGARKVIDPMASCFRDIFELAGLKGVGPSGIVPTWSNG